MQATEDELTYLKELVSRRWKQQEPIPSKQQGYISPSMIIDGFLYHGVLNHAMNKELLEELDIQYIISIDLDDDFCSDISQHFETTNEFLQSCKAKGDKVLAHCLMGVYRLSAIVLAYLPEYHDDPLNKAFDYWVERHRYAVPNLGFSPQLIRYDGKLSETKGIARDQSIDKKESPAASMYYQ